MRYIIAIAFVIGLGVFLEYTMPFDDTDEQPHRAFNRSGMSIKTDHGTGCQYLSSLFGGLTPRLGSDGEHICEGEER